MNRAARRTIGVASSALLIGAGAFALSPAQATGRSATYVTTVPSKTISYNGGTFKPSMVGLDTNGDKQVDTWAYCIEPRVTAPTSVHSGAVALTDFSLDRENLADAGKTRWVLANGYGAKSTGDLLNQVGLTSNGLTETDLKITMAAATQAALYKYSHGYTVSSTFKYDTRTTALGAHNTKVFNAVYAHLVTKAQWIAASGSWVVWDNKPGDPATQTVAEVPKDPQPTPTQSPTTSPTTGPTKTTEPTASPTTPAPTGPTKTTEPTSYPTKTPTPTKTSCWIFCW